jgi:hypothetical protein
VALALEPEPRCVLETTDEAVSFFNSFIFSSASVRAFADAAGLGPADAEEALRRHLGICLDACHAAVEFEDPAQSVVRLKQAGIRIVKAQVSAGLRVRPPDAAALAELGRFAEDVYLHQVVIRDGDRLTRFVDLPQALAGAAKDPEAAGEEWRVHFHVPLFREQLGPFTNTADFVRPLLAALAQDADCQHYEVETYTWDVLPAEYRNQPVVEAIARELRWTIEALGPGQPR